jgi:hypothetical protein
MKIRLLVALFCVIAILPDRASAIPAFARKYNMSCNVCHSVVPRLKAYGDEFAANAYQLKDREAARFTRQTGDDMLYLMRELPLAIRIDGYARYLPDSDTKSDVQWPYILKILSGGNITPDISYFFYFLFNERGDVAGVEDAFLYFNDVGGGPFDILVGQYQVADPVFKRELRPTFEDYQIYKARPGMAKADLTYDRGIILNYTFPTETDFFFSVVNGNGIHGADGGVFDSDPYKNLFLRLSQGVGDGLSIGSLGYIGKEREAGSINDLYMVGGDASVEFGDFELGGQFLYRQDKNPFFLAGRDSAVHTRGGFAELMYAPPAKDNRWFFFLLYNRITSGEKELDYHSVAGNVTYLVARNFKLMAEYMYDVEREKHGFTVGFMTAF